MRRNLVQKEVIYRERLTEIKLCKREFTVSVHHMHILYVCIRLVRVCCPLSIQHGGRESQSQLSVFNQALDTDSLP